jgi:hypothetical protein
MKKIVLTAFVCSIFSLPAVNAQPSCQSLFSNIVKAADGVIQKVSQLEQSAADALGPYIVTAATGIPPQFTNTPAAKNAISNMANAAIGVQNEILGLIGAVSGDGKGHVGPRYLYIPTKQVTGELIATERTFIITPSSYNKVTVTIKKRDGKAGAGVAVCAKWADGREYNTKDQKYFAEGENSIGTEQKWVFANMKDKFITIHLVHTGGLLNYFDYELSIEGEWEASALYAISSSNDESTTNKPLFKRPEDTPASTTTNSPSKTTGSKSNGNTATYSDVSESTQTKLDEAINLSNTNQNSNTTTKPETTKPITVPTRAEAVKNSTIPANNNMIPTKSEAAKNSAIRNTATPVTTNNAELPHNNTEKTTTTIVEEKESRKHENKQQQSNKETRPDKDEAKDRMKDKKAENRAEAEKKDKKDKTKERIEDKKEQKTDEETEIEKKGSSKEKGKQKRTGNL